MFKHDEKGQARFTACAVIIDLQVDSYCFPLKLRLPTSSFVWSSGRLLPRLCIPCPFLCPIHGVQIWPPLIPHRWTKVQIQRSLDGRGFHGLAIGVGAKRTNAMAFDRLVPPAEPLARHVHTIHMPRNVVCRKATFAVLRSFGLCQSAI